MSPRSWLGPTLLAVMTLVVIDSARFSGPLIDVAFEQSTAQAATVAVLTYAAVALPVALLAVTALRGRLLRATGISVILYVIARGAMQLFVGSLYPAALVVTTIALASWVLCLAAVRYAFTAQQTVSALLAGVALSVTSQLFLGTWDLAWRSDLTALILLTFGLMGLFLLGSFAITKQAAGTDLTPSRVHVSQLWPLGLWLAMVLMVFANPAFVAAQSGFSLGWAGALLIGAAAVGISLLSPDPSGSGLGGATIGRGLQRTGLAGAGFIAGITLAFILDGVAAVLAALIAFLLSAPILLDVLVDRGAIHPEMPVDLEEEIPRPGIGVLTVSALLIGLGTVLPILLFQLDYDIPLPVPNYLVITVAAAGIVAVALISLRTGSVSSLSASGLPARQDSSAPVVVALEKLGGGALLLTALFAGLMAPAIPSREDVPAIGAEQVRVLSWNLHYGVSAEPRVALDEISSAVLEHSPDVVLLQEVSRGWILGGGADMLTWLASGLDMEAAWAPAADSQFGNVVLSKWPVSEPRAFRLPYGAGPQNRSFASATIDHPMAQLRVTSTHLQHRAGNADTRIEQVTTLLGEVSATENSGLTILAGDFNATADSLEINAITDAGWESAQDAAGDSAANTHPSDNPSTRIDWLFSGPGLQPQTAEVLTSETPSDHLPLLADFTLAN